MFHHFLTRVLTFLLVIFGRAFIQLAQTYQKQINKLQTEAKQDKLRQKIKDIQNDADQKRDSILSSDHMLEQLRDPLDK